MTTERPAALVGAYAALPSLPADQERFYDGLAGRGIADGLEIPFRDGLGVDIRRLAAQMRGRFTRSVITLIPGTMVRVGATGVFGLASKDQDGRRAALDFLREARLVAEELNQLTGEQSVSALHIHTAPSKTAAREMFARSLDEIAASAPAEGAWSTRLVLEHCDAYAPAVPGEKRFLPLEDEIPSHGRRGSVSPSTGAVRRSRPRTRAGRSPRSNSSPPRACWRASCSPARGRPPTSTGERGRTLTCPSPRTSPPP